MAYIYALIHIATFKHYIGCTKGTVAKRMREHRCLLRAGKHTCRALQEDWTRYGEEAFAIKVYDEIPSHDLNILRGRELYRMHALNGSGLLYNEHLVSFAPTKEATRKGIEASRTVVGRRWTPEANLKRSLAQKGKPKGHGAKISATKQARKAQQVMI